jgi:hypothetical protein
VQAFSDLYRSVVLVLDHVVMTKPSSAILGARILSAAALICGIWTILQAREKRDFASGLELAGLGGIACIFMFSKARA